MADGIEMNPESPSDFNRSMAVNDLAYRLAQNESGDWQVMDQHEVAFEIDGKGLDDTTRSVIAAIVATAFVCGTQWAATKMALGA